MTTTFKMIYNDSPKVYRGQSSMRQIFKPLSALILGALLTLGFAPFHAGWLGFLVPLVLLILWDKASAQEALIIGFAFGFGFFVASTSWVFISVYDYGGANFMLSVLMVAALMTLMASYFALQGFILARFFGSYSLIKYLLAFPVLWFLFEWIRGHFLTGFPWVLLGYTQTEGALSGFAKLGSVYLVSAMICVVAGALYAMFQNRQRPKRVLLLGVLIVLLWVSGHLLKNHAFTKAVGLPKTVTLIQGNIAPIVKWDKNHVIGIMASYFNLTKNAWHPGFVIWPENALPILPHQILPYLAALNAEAQKNHVAFLTGMPLDNAVTGQTYNGAIALGEGSGIYQKRHLIPFGEYVPFQNVFGPVLSWLSIPMSSFAKGSNQQMLITMQHLKAAVYICYESTYPEEIRNTLNGADVIITLTDDSWFGHSLGAFQHFQMEEMRAIETGRFILRATNTGVTSIIGPDGAIIARAPTFQQAILVGQFSPMQGATPWLSIGPWPWLILSLVLLLLAYSRQKRYTGAS